jgi:hypothetical protein
MKKKQTILRGALAFAVIAAVFGAATAAQAAAPALQGQINLRPLSPQDIKDYSLTGLQGASGLMNVGIGQPAYLDVLVNNAVPNADITNVSFSLTAAPVGSAAALEPSPLGTNVPAGRMIERKNSSGNPTLKVAGRKLLRPDVTGQYVVTATIQTGASGSTNVTQTINASTYVGLQTCALCHSGGVGADNIYLPWSHTGHATFFAEAIDGKASDHYGKNCISCHTLGYDVNTNAVNGGFDDIAKQLNWNFPTVLTNGNWDSMPTALKNVSNIQCENCHGPGSLHAFSLGDPKLISKSFAAGDCAQCHDSKPTHPIQAEYNNSFHATATKSPSGANRAACVRCHTAAGLVEYLAVAGTTNTYTLTGLNTTYESITCSACHDPHDASKPHQLRTVTPSVLADGFTVMTNAGLGSICSDCHRSRNGSVTNSIYRYPLGLQTWIGGSSFGVHDNPASDMLAGINGWTYGLEIPSSGHRYTVTNSCVGCHMQPVDRTDPGFTLVGGHTMKMSYQVVANGTTNTVDKTTVCTTCHGPMTSFDMVRADYDGNGVAEGVQTEVQSLLNNLSRLLPNSAYQSNGNYVADGLVKSSISAKTNWQSKFLKAGYNWQFVNNDWSKGVHNTAYAVGLLRASIGDLTDDRNHDALPDTWQIQYFGSATDPKAAPNATPAGDGIPNWLKFNLGLDPMKKGIEVPGGVVWANGGTLLNSRTEDEIAIYTAAEVVFNTEVGKTYQLEAISTLGDGWKPVGDPIPGTGTSMSFVTPTRQGVQQFYRVAHTP